jgi:hypothetical protein
MAISKEVEKIEGLEIEIDNLETLIENSDCLLPNAVQRLQNLKEERAGYGKICTECDSQGMQIDKSKINSQTQDVPYKPCERCGGSKIC